jgi:EAL domain-containing protein (putative c-di-GMP-specific phosphodiesterase class I)
MTTVAEGVETADQLALVRRQGCALVRGYLFSRPRPVREVPALIRSLRVADQGHVSVAAV